MPMGFASNGKGIELKDLYTWSFLKSVFLSAAPNLRINVNNFGLYFWGLYFRIWEQKYKIWCQLQTLISFYVLETHMYFFVIHAL